ncbi:hypothetical protein DUNSADRAFT_4276 [Dunaliella salina]|uniref:Uncharacterized protein n=1 Tax=Dunaliella salina TaxID=3046 RepID=A0ABQ7GS78_DUNSA|nr:hypothetical protein DUNSADRAFT_4276 [Dunaliella salina]|eukprot:KAF5837474.1 hypothetical protein DUNSADRAFT_4276 [Dunaliella salina]
MALARGVLLQTVLGRHISWTAQQGMLGAVPASSRPLSASLQAFATQAEPEKDNQQQQQAAGPQPGTSTQHAQADQAEASGSKSAGPQGEASSADATTSSSSSSSSSSDRGSSGASTSGQEGASSSQSSSSGADPRVEDMTQRLFKTFRSGYQNMRSKVESASKGSSDGSQDRRLLKEAAKEMQAVFRTGDHIRSATRMYTGPVAVMPEGDGAGGPSELVLSKRRPTTWQKIHEKVSTGTHGQKIHELGA